MPESNAFGGKFRRHPADSIISAHSHPLKIVGIDDKFCKFGSISLGAYDERTIMRSKYLGEKQFWRPATGL